MDKGDTHFVLVHGACHGAWCWYKVVAILRAEGHRVSVLDMAASGIHPKRIEELNSIVDYNEPLMEFMAALKQEERVVLVGHSMGGVNISLAMEKFPHKISVAVFVAAFMPGPNLDIIAVVKQYNRQLGIEFEDKGQENGPNTILLGPKLLASNFYELSPAEDLTLATYLVRPVKVFDGTSILKDTALSNEKYGSVRRVYVVCDKDNVLKEEQFQRWLIKNNPTDAVEVITDTDHMVMLCKPRELCNSLLMIAAKYH